MFSNLSPSKFLTFILTANFYPVLKVLRRLRLKRMSKLTSYKISQSLSQDLN